MPNYSEEPALSICETLRKFKPNNMDTPDVEVGKHGTKTTLSGCISDISTSHFTYCCKTRMLPSYFLKLFFYQRVHKPR